MLAWRQGLEHTGIKLAVWRSHPKIGMSGGLFVNALLRETRVRMTADQTNRLPQLHAEAYAHYTGQVRPLPWRCWKR